MILTTHQEPTKSSGSSSKKSKKKIKISYQPLNKDNFSLFREFSCGDESIDSFVQISLNEQDKNFSRVYLCFDEKNEIVSFFTLSAASVDSSNLPKKIKPSFGTSPCILLGQLAVKDGLHGLGYGTTTLKAAIKAYLEACKAVGSVALIVDSYSDKTWLYSKLAFQELVGKKKKSANVRMYLLTETMKKPLVS